MKVGISAWLEIGGSVHRDSFVQAVETAKEHFSLPECEFFLADDGANPEQARQAATEFCARGVQLVIGHFSSSAALAALPIYQRHNVAVILPAATSNDISRYSNALQLCAPDDVFASCVVEDMVRHSAIASVSIRSDDSIQGSSLREYLNTEFDSRGIETRAICTPDYSLFCGTFDHSVEAVTSQAMTGKVVLFDDALCPELAEALIDFEPPIYIYGFKPSSAYDAYNIFASCHENLFGNEVPRTYFMETMVAFQILAALSQKENLTRIDSIAALLNQRFDTAIGTIEARTSPVNKALYRLNRGTIDLVRFVG